MISSLVDFLESPAVLIEIASVKGSSPREAGTFMLVSKDRLWETIGGGQFEYIAIDHARAMLNGKTEQDTLDIPLGPEIGQCCGGRTLLCFSHVTPELKADLEARLNRETSQQPSVFIFGAGHVGKALASSLSLLPLSVSVIETRAHELEGLPSNIEARTSAMPESLIGNVPAGSAVIIVTHDHALDFLIAKEALARNDLAYTGMIGSKTKRATFAHWLDREGEPVAHLDRLTLPIGGTAVRDKRPAIIAALVAAELLQAFQVYATTSVREHHNGHPAHQDHA